MTKLFDPETYRQLDVPFESSEDANKVLEAFYADVSEIRKKYRLPDVFVVVRVSIKDGDDECFAMSRSHFGNAAYSESIAAWALGAVQAERETEIGKLLAQGVMNPKRRK